MQLRRIESFYEIIELMENGNWSNAQELFKAINPSPAEFTEWISEVDVEVVKDFALLGFYCREYEPLENGNYD